jgi:ACS family tartrate transporter-like MFS transporter
MMLEINDQIRLPKLKSVTKELMPRAGLVANRPIRPDYRGNRCGTALAATHRMRCAHMTDRGLLAKCAWRLIPVMGLLYLVNYIDRVNAGFAALTMNMDLGFSASVFGLGAGIFFAGYLLFQIPANVIVERLGARLSVFGMMMVWGALSAATALIQTPLAFYVLRFLLGVAEAGFFPGMIFYLTLWFPRSERALFTAAFTCAIPLSGIIGGPVSGVILQNMNSLLGLHAWQWLFVLEGLPVCVLAVAVLKLLPDGPAQAPWLSEAEKKTIAAGLANQTVAEKSDLSAALHDPRVLAIAFAGIGRGAALYGATLWMPLIVQAMGFSNLLVGFIVPIPSLASVIAIVLWGYSSDRSGDRIWHVALPTLLAAFGFAGAAVFTDNTLVLACLTAAMVGLTAAASPHFVLASSFLRGSAAAGSIALLNSGTSLGGFVGPFLVGVLKDQTGNYALAMAMLAFGLLLSALIILGVGRILRPVDFAAAKRADA